VIGRRRVDVVLTRPCSVVAVCEQSLARQQFRLLCIGDGMSLRPEPYDNDKDAELGTVTALMKDGQVPDNLNAAAYQLEW